MTLIQEVERIEDNSIKINKTKNNINNKLLELGGENATNLAEVPEKISNLIKNHYKKVAIINEVLISLKGPSSSQGYVKYTQDVSINLDFNPSLILIFTERLPVPNQTTTSEVQGCIGISNLKPFRFYGHSTNSMIAEGELILKDNNNFTLDLTVYKKFNINAYAIICIE